MRDAAALDFLLGWAGGYLPVYRENGHGVKTAWLEAGRNGLASFAAESQRLRSDDLHVGLPCKVRFGGPTMGTVLWCRIEGQDQLDRARRHRPLPSMVVQEGRSTRRVLIWALEDRAGYVDIETMNRRLAYRFGAVQRFGVPENLRVPVPGTFLRAGRSRPVAVVTTRLEPDFYSLTDVAGRLKDPPPAWNPNRER